MPRDKGKDVVFWRNCGDERAAGVGETDESLQQMRLAEKPSLGGEQRRDNLVAQHIADFAAFAVAFEQKLDKVKLLIGKTAAEYRGDELPSPRRDFFGNGCADSFRFFGVAQNKTRLEKGGRGGFGKDIQGQFLFPNADKDAA